ncbi:uncharacterized protein NECHADRAFT_52693 [Fusarium vanettenii 77-13-4]|uniref:NmrA-like domain-containing protein n=1 Tax=Fusarium vanettenii (strain ATCC MYA-4622 / CBS 123669 / FGSC 9596 / NRRL 45880 / 77-13-4) TaxID=660122 RepID=C7ZI64_FUSV7|nr:uncharacterized protein NECHADRAFT_52693 [Fusarium vanettenii 77-13-4]EEU36403.1 hypothetical protein NECHADRAFT_52693 [Fusarium vanettenii 77-13-4]
MSSQNNNLPIVFVVGATGAQGIPVVRDLVKDGAYKVRFLTRDANSPRAKALTALGNVEPLVGTFASEEDLRKGFRGAQYAFTFWAIRSYELALEEGIKFFVYGNLDFSYKKSGYDPKFRTGHYDGKGRIAEWILQQNKDPKNAARMGAAIFTTGPYMTMAIAAHTPMSPRIEDGVVTWRVPLGDGAVCHVDLDDCGYYVRWLFEHQKRANGMDLEVAIDLISYNDLAKAFEKVSGHPARYIDTDLDTYWTSGPLGDGTPSSGYNSDLNDPAAMTIRQNFTGFWNIWKASGGNKGLVQRDFKLLDEIHPGRVKSAEEWFRKEEKKGIEHGLGDLWDRVNNLRPVLKLVEDRRKGRL